MNEGGTSPCSIVIQKEARGKRIVEKIDNIVIGLEEYEVECDE